jgi:hypothetical protein
MNLSRFSPRLEQLEDRTVPATLRLVGGSAFISNQTSATMTLQAQGTNNFTLTDGALTVNFNVGGTLYVRGTNKADTINIDLNGFAFNGNLIVDTGNGADTLNIFTSVDGGSIGGNVTTLTGRGNDTLSLNNTAATSMDFRGRTLAYDFLGNDQINLGNDTGVTRFLGDVNVLGFNDVNVGFTAADVYGHDLTIRALPDGQPLDVFFNANASFGRDINIFGGQRDDAVNFKGPNTVERNVNITLGNGVDSITVSDTGTGGAPITVDGDFNLDMGEGDNFYDLDNTFDVNGDVTIRAGNGDNNISNYNGNVGGDLRVFVGNGTNAIFLATTAITIGGDFLYFGGNGFNNISYANVTLGGDSIIRVGNGLNIITVNDPALIGGTFNVRAGNGTNLLAFFTAAAPLHLDVVLGNGDDNVAFAGAGGPVIVDGFLDGGGGTNTLLQFNTIFLPTFVLKNF